MLKLLVLSTAVASAAAFAPSTTAASRAGAALGMSEEVESSSTTDQPDFTPSEVNAFDSSSSAAAAPAPAAAAAINGWVADESLPCFGLPGALAPTGFFDPLGFARDGISLNEVKRNREAEVMHGRVAMVAAVGYLAGEAFAGPFSIVGPANDQLAQVPAPAFAILTATIAALELKRATIGWVEPDFGSWSKTLWKLRDNYYPGDVGFDPLGLKPTDAEDFADMQTRELQNGRLAMIGVAGMCAQELVNHRTIAETFGFYQKVYSGVNPYETCGDLIIC